MERAATYGIKELAELAGVSARTLRHYEDEGLLSPARDKAGWRVYDEHDARRLAEILAMRRCGIAIRDIRRLLEDDAVRASDALREHLAYLEQQQKDLAEQVRRTRAALEAAERMDEMKTRQAFERLKEDEIARNERLFGREARERYGDAEVDAANERTRSLSEHEWDERSVLERQILDDLTKARETGVDSDEGARLVRDHRRWIELHWGQGSYTTEAHLGLAQLYLADPRFTAYYDDACGDGAAAFLVEALRHHLSRGAS